MSDAKNIRHRFTVPANDTVVNEWIENQSNLAFSLRTLISTYVKQMGMTDPTCELIGLDRPLPTKGRPRNDAKEKLINFNPNMSSGQAKDEDLEVGSTEQVKQETMSTEKPNTEHKHENVTEVPAKVVANEKAAEGLLDNMSKPVGSNVSQDLLDSLGM